MLYSKYVDGSAYIVHIIYIYSILYTYIDAPQRPKPEWPGHDREGDAYQGAGARAARERVGDEPDEEVARRDAGRARIVGGAVDCVVGDGVDSRETERELGKRAGWGGLVAGLMVEYNIYTSLSLYIYISLSLSLSIYIYLSIYIMSRGQERGRWGGVGGGVDCVVGHSLDRVYPRDRMRAGQ